MFEEVRKGRKEGERGEIGSRRETGGEGVPFFIISSIARQLPQTKFFHLLFCYRQRDR